MLQEFGCVLEIFGLAIITAIVLRTVLAVVNITFSKIIAELLP